MYMLTGQKLIYQNFARKRVHGVTIKNEFSLSVLRQTESDPILNNSIRNVQLSTAMGKHLQIMFSCLIISVSKG